MARNAIFKGGGQLLRAGASKRLGIVFALDAEEYGLRRVLEESRSLASADRCHHIRTVGNTELIVEISGIGRERCEAATEHLIDRGARWVICAGFATGLATDVMPGDVIVANRVLLHNAEPKDPQQCSRSLLTAVPPSGALGYRIRYGDLVTQDTIVRMADERSHIFRATGAIALDMESYAAAEVCDRRGVPFLAIRGISDGATQDLPEEIEALARLDTVLDQFVFLVQRPRIWRDVLRLRRQASAAANNLGDTLGTIILRLI